MIMSRIHPAEKNGSLSSCQDLWTRKHTTINTPTTTGSSCVTAAAATATTTTSSIDVVQKEDGVGRTRPAVLTVWKRSSMSFQGTDGFTVFDHHGGLVFRVDNYTRKTRLPPCAATSVLGASGGGGGGGGGELILMDGSGKALITLKPQVFSMKHQWNGYRGEGDECGGRKSSSYTTTTTSPNPKCSKVFAMRRSVSSSMLLLTHKKEHPCEAEVFMQSSTGLLADFRIEGSFRMRNCKIKKPSTGELAAKIVRKRAATTNLSTTILLSDDVFSLVVQPGFDPELIMAFVVILDRICSGGSGKPFAPLLCS